MDVDQDHMLSWAGIFLKLLFILKPFMAKSAQTKSAQFNFRIDQELRSELDEACKKVGLDSSMVARALLEAFVKEVKTTGKITFPIALVSEDSKKGASVISQPGDVPERIQREGKGRSRTSTALPPDRLMLNEKARENEPPAIRRDVSYIRPRRSGVSDQE